LSPMIGGIVMMIVSYFIGSCLLMSLVCLGDYGRCLFLPEAWLVHRFTKPVTHHAAN